MRLPILISRRYFFSRNNPGVVNIITGISVLGYAIGAAGLVILMSALNGFESIIFSTYQNTDADYVMLPVAGKRLEVGDALIKDIGQTKGVKAVVGVLKDKAILRYGDNQTACEVVGVDEGIKGFWQMDSVISEGKPVLYDEKQASRGMVGDMAWMGEGLVYRLGVGTIDAPIRLMVMNQDANVMSVDAYNESIFIPSAMLKLPEEESSKRVYIGLEQARSLFLKEGYSELMVRFEKGLGVSERVRLEEELGRKVAGNKEVKWITGQEQHGTLYKMFNTEKWISFGILAFVLLLISFNLIGALSLLVIDKQRDFLMMFRMGMRLWHIRLLVFLEGIWVAITGTVLGLILGVGLVLLQQRFGLVKTESTFTLAYPVELRIFDLGWICLLTMGLGLFSAYIPGYRAGRSVIARNN